MMRLLHQNASGGEVQHTQHKLERALGAPLHGNRLEKLVGFERSGDGNTIPGESERHAARGAGEAEGGAQVAGHAHLMRVGCMQISVAISFSTTFSLSFIFDHIFSRLNKSFVKMWIIFRKR